MCFEEPDVLFGSITGQSIHGGIQPGQAALFRFLHPLVGIIIPVEDDALMIVDGPDDQVMQGGTEIIRILQLICELAQAFGHNSVQDYVGIGNGIRGAQGAKLKFIAGEGEGRGPVPVGGILRELGQHMDADSHIGLLAAVVDGTGFQGFQDLGEFITEEDADDGGRGFAAAQTVIVAG